MEHVKGLLYHFHGFDSLGTIVAITLMRVSYEVLRVPFKPLIIMDVIHNKACCKRKADE